MLFDLVLVFVMLLADLVAGPTSPRRLLDLPMFYEAEPLLEKNVTGIIDSITSNYDKRVRPNFGVSPLEAAVSMYILSISSVSEANMDFTLDFYFRLVWKDPRLTFLKLGDMDSLFLGPDFINNIWTPDTFFINEKTSVFHLTTDYNAFVRVKDDGTVTRSIRLTITAACPMNLQYFPMDRQLCHLELGSFGYTVDDIRYKWKEGPQSVEVSSNVSLPQFRLLGHRIRDKNVSFDVGNYSRLICELQFQRAMGYYVTQVFVPSGLVVIVSWVSFWIEREAAEARVPLGVTTVLTMTTLISSTNEALPKVSCIKAIDVYLVTCFLMVFGSLLEYAAVGYLAKKIRMRKIQYLTAEKAKEYTKIEINPARQSWPGVKIIIPSDLDAIWGIAPSDIDKYSRVVFPVSFVCFNLTYWIIYLNISNGVDEGLVKIKLEM